MIKQVADGLQVPAQRGVNGRLFMLDGWGYRIRKVAPKDLMIGESCAEGVHNGSVGQVRRKQGAADDARVFLDITGIYPASA